MDISVDVKCIKTQAKRRALKKFDESDQVLAFFEITYITTL